MPAPNEDDAGRQRSPTGRTPPLRTSMPFTDYDGVDDNYGETILVPLEV